MLAAGSTMMISETDDFMRLLPNSPAHTVWCPQRDVFDSASEARRGWLTQIRNPPNHIRPAPFKDRREPFLETVETLCLSPHGVEARCDTRSPEVFVPPAR